MMPLNYADTGEENVIRKINGKPEIRQHLENMGFVTGAVITVVSSNNGNLIVSVKNTRVALDSQLAGKIMI